MQIVRGREVISPKWDVCITLLCWRLGDLCGNGGRNTYELTETMKCTGSSQTKFQQKVPPLPKKLFSTDTSWERKIRFHNTERRNTNHTLGQASCPRTGDQYKRNAMVLCLLFFCCALMGFAFLVFLFCFVSVVGLLVRERERRWSLSG